MKMDLYRNKNNDIFHLLGKWKTSIQVELCIITITQTNYEILLIVKIKIMQKPLKKKIKKIVLETQFEDKKKIKTQLELFIQIKSI